MIHGDQQSRGGGLIRTSEAACWQDDGTPGCPRQAQSHEVEWESSEVVKACAISERGGIYARVWGGPALDSLGQHAKEQATWVYPSFRMDHG